MPIQQLYGMERDLLAFALEHRRVLPRKNQGRLRSGSSERAPRYPMDTGGIQLQCVSEQEEAPASHNDLMCQR
jgi:hypothetical protein